MNAARRKLIASLNGSITETFANTGELVDKIQELLEEEQDAFDNMPESFQNGERGSACLVAVTNLENAAEALGSAVERVEECIAALNEAAT
jgi:hypothetical protein